MANLSNINGKFVVEQTTGYVGVGTTDPNFLIEAAGANSEIALNSTSGSIYRVRSTSGDAFIITKNGVGDRLTIDGTGNSIFSGTISAVGASTFNLGEGIFIKAVNTSNAISASNFWGYGLYEGASRIGEFSMVRDGSSSVYVGTSFAGQKLILGTAAKVPALTIDASQNVGIGTASPGSLLHLKKATLPRIALTRTGILDWFIGNPSQGTSNNFTIGTNSGGNTEILTLTNTGNVGIGTTSPSSKLHVTGAPANGVYLSYLYNSGTHNSSHGLNVQTAANNIATYGLRVNTGGNSNALAVMGNGGVGIGVTPFAHSLGTSVNIDLLGNGGIWGYNNATYANANAYYDSGWKYKSNGPAAVLQVGGSTPSLTFRQAGSGTAGAAITYTQPFTILASGKVGISTITPGANLEVKTLSGGSGVATLRLNTNFGSGNAVDINPFITGINNGGMEIKLAGTQRLVILPSGNVGIGTNTPGDAKLYVNGGTTLAGTNNDSDGAIRMYGDRKLPQATYFVKRNYKLTAGSSDALYSIARQWHDHANWGLGNINVIMWGIYFGKNNFSKADFSCRYGYSGGAADVVANFNPGSIAIPSWTAATQVSGNIHYRDLQITVPAYWQISFEIISPGCAQTYNVNNTAHNTVYLYPH